MKARIIIIALTATVLMGFGPGRASADPPTEWDLVLFGFIQGLQAENSALQARVDALEATLVHMTVQPGEINGVSGPHVIFTGANVHIRSGSGTTEDQDSLTGLGNLIVGYNEGPSGSTGEEGRYGSHNMVIGMGHIYPSHGGLVAGHANAITGESASVTGGMWNTASGNFSSVSGGWLNVSSGNFSSISGGYENAAMGQSSSVSGGWRNTAGDGSDGGAYSSILGGQDNVTIGAKSCVSGGHNSTASGGVSSISGGKGHEAAGKYSTVSGGDNNTASGLSSTVSGGKLRSAVGQSNWVAGQLFQSE